MTFDKWLGVSRNKKREKRKPYRGGKACCYSCRNHGGCEWCEANRKYSYIKSKQAANDKIKDWENDDYKKETDNDKQE